MHVEIASRINKATKERALTTLGKLEQGLVVLAGLRDAKTGCPGRREQLARLAVHVEIASRINKATEERALTTLGKLEQDLVFGDATSKEVIAFLAAHGNTPAQEKVRESGQRGVSVGFWD